MGALTIHKVVSTLPATLAPDAVYAVRAGVGFDLYIADATGSVAHKINGSTAAVMPDGQTTLTWTDGLLTRTDYPDGSFAVFAWVGGVLQSVATTRDGSTRTRTLTWAGGVLQSVDTTTTP